MVGDKLCKFIPLCRFPSQLQDLFEFFKENLELNLDSAVQNNPFLVVLLAGFPLVVGEGGLVLGGIPSYYPKNWLVPPVPPPLF